MTEPVFHPDFGKTDRIQRQAVSPRSLGPLRFLMKLGGWLSGRGVEKAVSATGQKIWVFRPEAAGPHPAILWIHGGGLIFGHPLIEKPFARDVARELGAVVACPFYRLAPEDPYPAGLEDVYAALQWLAAQPGVDPTRIAVGGDSAGGGLAAALTILARERGGPAIRFQLLHEPMLDEATRRAAAPDPETLRLWTPEINTWAWDGYLQDVRGPVPETASPSRIEDPAGLPAAWVGVGTRDLFHAEARDYADRLSAAGVPVTFHDVPGGFHGFAQVRKDAAVSRAYVARMKAALADAFKR
ncbi:alpha/beta hydrolase [Maritimibacter sp. UBA3975]|uniref:alpha/beta hydrolase n=1 Tax=Maritimibacter sp. UBA3975 TaxID=1946833 RepID=UPI000C0933B8|nr:alpha/beta hydrolase [Maritimibacter sp. UBA3975]MAM62641.1 alpha/beta hydrolase [Maritimibacter sp.]|tara:strand:+ start:23173 stop:24069 length:897 start_codon:yes stop_codon:yes gene_type:complete